MRGRKPIPTEIKELKGTLEKSRMLKNEMSVELSNTIPDAPEDLNEEAKQIWVKICEELKRNRILAVVDLDLVESYCHEMALYKHATRMIKQKGGVFKSPSGYPMINPWLTIKRQALKSATDLGVLFGLTPSARSRIPNNNPQTNNKLELLKKPKTA
jgi:P27 family predicted phage terminase small subunit